MITARFFQDVTFLSKFQRKILLKCCNIERKNLIGMETWKLSHPSDSCFTLGTRVAKEKVSTGVRFLTAGNTHPASMCVRMFSRVTLGKAWTSGWPWPVRDGWSLVSAAFSGPLFPYLLSRGHYQSTSKVVLSLNIL